MKVLCYAFYKRCVKLLSIIQNSEGNIVKYLDRKGEVIMVSLVNCITFERKAPVISQKTFIQWIVFYNDNAIKEFSFSSIVEVIHNGRKGRRFVLFHCQNRCTYLLQIAFNCHIRFKIYAQRLY